MAPTFSHAAGLVDRHARDLKAFLIDHRNEIAGIRLFVAHELAGNARLLHARSEDESIPPGP